MISEMNELLTAIEETAWELRALSDEFVELGGEARVWKERGKRLSSTGWMMTRVVADYRLFGIYSAFLPRRKIAEVKERIHRRSARRFYETSVQQKGAFLKVGQMLSSRPDLLPAAWIEELSGLQDAAPAEPFAHVRAVVEADLGAPLAERFRSFDEAPLAAASIGQVHRAVTLDGVEVAVKVQRPEIAELIEHDLALLDLSLQSMTGMLPPMDYATITTEVRDMVRRELDYPAEARAMARMRAFLDGMPGVKVPQPIDALCGPRVLTATFASGEKITTALDKLAGDHARISELLGNLLEVYVRQVLGAGFFQADPHPGNFLVDESGALVLLDFGCTRALGGEVRDGYRALVRAFLAGDTAQLTSLFAQLGFRTQSGRPDTLLAFAAALLDSFRRGAATGTFSWPTRDELFANARDLLAAAERDPVTRIPPEFVLLGRVFGTLAGLLQHHRPSIDFPRHILPHL